ELGELDAGCDEDDGRREHADPAGETGDGFAARPHARPDIHLEMRRFPHTDHGADHDRPDEEEPRHFLRPDVGRNERGVAGEDLQTDRKDQYADRNGHQPGEEVGVPGREASPERTAVRRKRRKCHWVITGMCGNRTAGVCPRPEGCTVTARDGPAPFTSSATWP